MSEPAAPTDRDDALLARLAELDLSAAERVHGKLMAAEAAGEIAELGRTYQRIARSLRQTLALKAKLKRDREAAANDPARPRPPGAMAVTKRARELRVGVERVIWDEAEDADEAAAFEDALDQLILDEMQEDGFCDETLDDHVVRVCLFLGLSPQGAERWRWLADAPPANAPPAVDPEAPPDGFSSA